ncbi:protein archease [Candidatus Pacearchaeota archaeon]|nr:protein archease [Candidatus Pacearchaeota archaeon]
MKTKKFQFLEHTADIKFQAFGKTKEKAFENSALAMFDSMSDDAVKEKTTKTVKVRGKDDENLLYEFLEELLFLFDSELFFVSKIKNIEINKESKKSNQQSLKAELVGDSAENYEMKNDIKAVTYNEMFVKKNKKNDWVCQVVLDI